MIDRCSHMLLMLHPGFQFLGIFVGAWNKKSPAFNGNLTKALSVIVFNVFPSSVGYGVGVYFLYYN